MSDNVNQKQSSNKKLGIISLALINVAAVLSLRNFPAMAVEGWGMIFWYVLFTVCFLLPTALVAAELASTWPKAGGIYAWVKEAFPGKGSFITIWCSWVNNIVWFPTVVSFIMVTIAYAILQPALGDNTIFMAAVMLGVMWILTFFNFTGMKHSTKLSTIGTVIGALIPITILVVLTFAWLAQGNVSEMGDLTLSALVPDMNFSMLTFAASLVLMFAGMEMAGYHARETENPQKDYPIAMFIAALVICVVSILGTWSVGTLVPASFLNGPEGLNGGVIQAFQVALDSFNFGWMIVPLGLMLAVGIVAQLSTWMMGPAKGLAPAAYNGDLPPMFRKVNKNGAPVGVLVIQAAVSSGFVILYLVLDALNINGYWVLVAITSLINIIMYLFMFTAFLKLRNTQPNVKRPFKLPGGKVGAYLVGGVAIATLIFGFIFGLYPSETLSETMTVVYIIGVFAAVIVISVLPPFIIDRWLKKDSWKPTAEELRKYEESNDS